MTTGEYRILDRPHVDSDGVDDALAPDGRQIAYWTTGDTQGSPYTEAGSPIVGVAVCDTSTGDVRGGVA